MINVTDEEWILIEGMVHCLHIKSTDIVALILDYPGFQNLQLNSRGIGQKELGLGASHFL